MGGIRLAKWVWAAILAATLLLIAAPAQADDGVGLVDPGSGQWFLRAPDTGDVNSFYFGNPGDVPFLGDWDCDGMATPGLFRTTDAFAYLSNANVSQNADIRFFFGNPSDIPLAGDFNGNGCDTLSIYRPSEQRFYIMNKLGENEGGLGAADYSFVFGNPGDKPVVGDWDGDSIDEIGLHRESTGFFYYRNTLNTGVADAEFYFGDPGDRFVAGDWGIVDSVDTPAVYRPGNTTFFFRHSNTPGNADSQFVWGNSTWLPVAGPLPSGSVKVEPESVLLVDPGDTEQLSAVVRDHAGTVIAEPVTWISDNPAAATVDASGRVTAVAIGQARVTASGGGATSEPVVITVVDLAPGARQVEDSQIIEPPQLVGSPSSDVVGSVYELTMAANAAPTVGDILVGSRDSGVAGRVLSVSPTSGGVVVEIETVPLTDVFDAIEVDYTDAMSLPTARALGSFSCTKSLGADIGFTSSFNAWLESNLTPTGDVDWSWKWKWKFWKSLSINEVDVFIDGRLSLRLAGGVQFSPSASGSAECTLQIVDGYYPVWGPFGVSADLFVGVGIGASGVVSDPLFANVNVTVPVDTKLGFSWDNGHLTGYDKLNVGGPAATFDFGLPSGGGVEVNAYLFGEAELGASAVNIVDFPMVEGRFGLSQRASLRTPNIQMDHPDYMSRYWLYPYAQVGAGDGVRGFLQLLGLSGNWIDWWQWDGDPLAHSPQGWLGLNSGSVSVGSAAGGTIGLSSQNYLGLYNVSDVRVYGRLSGGGAVVQLGSATVAYPGQTSFAWSWLPSVSQTGTWEVAAFVVTKGIPGVPLQVSDIAYLDVSVPSNLPPVAIDDSYDLAQGQVLSIGAPGVMGNDWDPEGAPIVVAHLSYPAHGSLDLFADGSFDYYHDGTAFTSDSFTYTISDGVNESTSATVYLSIDANDPPVAVDDYYTVGRGEVLSIGGPGVLGNDWDPEGSSLLIAHHSFASHGTVSMGDDGAFTYTHDGLSATSDSFTYTVTDGVSKSSATVYLTIVGSGDVRVSLDWWSTADLDLYVTDPFGETVYYGNSSSASGGELDLDANFPCESATTSPVENIYWPTGGAPLGEYVVEVRYAVDCAGGEGPESLMVTTSVDGWAEYYWFDISPGESLEVARFTR